MQALITFVLVCTIAACAHSVKKAPDPAPAVEVPAQPTSPVPFDPVLRMPLPYSFSRRGVQVRVNSVEFAKDQLRVSVTCEETRGQEVAIRASNLMEPQTESKKVMPYIGYLQDGKMQLDSDLSFSPNQRRNVDLAFQFPPEAAGNPVLIQFTSGKWWSSKD